MSNVIKFQSPFERLKLFDTSPDISLRKAIITQAIIDASNVSNDKTARKRELEAKTWIFTNNNYFKSICLDAGMEPSFVVKITKQIIKLQKTKSLTRKSEHRDFKKGIFKSQNVKNNVAIHADWKFGEISLLEIS